MSAVNTGSLFATQSEVGVRAGQVYGTGNVQENYDGKAKRVIQWQHGNTHAGSR